MLYAEWCTLLQIFTDSIQIFWLYINLCQFRPCIPFQHHSPLVHLLVQVGYRFVSTKPSQNNKHLKTRCPKTLNILKSLTRRGRGTLLKLYRSLVRSKLDYGCAVYESAAKISLAELDPLHNQGLRVGVLLFTRWELVCWRPWTSIRNM